MRPLIRFAFLGVIVRPTGGGPWPTALEFTIYVDPARDLSKLEYAASRGYAGVMAYTRGKGNASGRRRGSCRTRMTVATQTA